MLATYSGLQTSLARWLSRDNLTAYIPDFISLCEAKFNRDLRIQNMEQRVTATLDEEYEDLPTDFAEMRSISITGAEGRTLQYAPPEDLRLKYPDGTVGTPVLYTIIGTTIQFGPPPSGSFSMEMVYYKKFSALSASVTTNWMLTNAPDVYLYGSLAEAEPFIKNDARVALWKGLYEQAVSSVRDEDVRARHSGSPLVQRVGVSS